ncbi:MAG TPA: hypothetical protein VEW42_01265 [Candidatus Eisenbacteria bacterium]|nr:hypothetical protein [Candidatus Eisenbacteria bacterium]
MEEKKEKSVFHSFTGGKPFFTPKLLVLFLVVIIAGFVVGYFLVSMQAATMSSSQSATSANGTSVKKGAVYGSDDTATFKDTVEGTMTAGGVDGEGQFHLVRPGGDSQNVYMTSSLVDLSLFLGKKVKVWGQTQKAQTAGWLMDVGRVEVLE